MESIFIIFIFLFGLVIGSFLNVVIFRYNSGRTLGGRSFCTSCGKKLRWYELIPVFSFIFLRGRCKKCGSRISWQYPLVELSTGLVFLLVFWKFGSNFAQFGWKELLFAAYSLSAWCLLIPIFVYDLRHKIIPDGLVYTFIVLSFLYRLGLLDFSRPLSLPTYLDLLAGPMLFLPFFLLWYFSKGTWMGLGDGKLALGIGFMLGFSMGISAVIFAFWIGAAVSLGLLAVSRLFRAEIPLNSHLKNLTIKSEIAFGPFLIIGVAAAYFLGLAII